MANNRKKVQEKSSSCLIAFFSIFSTSTANYKKSRSAADIMRPQKVWPSDEDGGRWGVGRPGIDRDASHYIGGVKDKFNNN